MRSMSIRSTPDACDLGAEAHEPVLDALVALAHDYGLGRQQDAVTANDGAAVGEVERRHRHAAGLHVVPDVQFGPVAEREDAEVLPRMLATVEEIPQFGALLPGLPLTETVAVREETLLGAGLLLVAARPAECRVEAELGQRVEQGHRL
jgi:hypothetical protein